MFSCLEQKPILILQSLQIQQVPKGNRWLEKMAIVFIMSICVTIMEKLVIKKEKHMFLLDNIQK